MVMLMVQIPHITMYLEALHSLRAVQRPKAGAIKLAQGQPLKEQHLIISSSIFELDTLNSNVNFKEEVEVHGSKGKVVIGGNFAGMTAALEIKRKGKDRHRVIVIDKSPLFLFIPSLIWVPLGRREVKDISFRKDEILNRKGVEFVQTEALEVDPENNIVKTKKGNFTYDHLVVATGPKGFIFLF